MFATAWRALMTLELLTMFFLERLNDDSKRIFLSAQTSSKHHGRQIVP